MVTYKQKSIEILDHRSEYSGDSRPGQTRIKQIVEVNGRDYEIWTDPKSDKVTIYCPVDEKLYCLMLQQRAKPAITRSPILDGKFHDYDVIGVKIHVMENGVIARTIEDISFTTSDDKGFQQIRNNLVLPEDTMINHGCHRVASDLLREKYTCELGIVREAKHAQQRFIYSLVRDFEKTILEARSCGV